MCEPSQLVITAAFSSHGGDDVYSRNDRTRCAVQCDAAKVKHTSGEHGVADSMLRLNRHCLRK